MGFYPKKQLSSVDLRGTVSIGGVALTSTAAELNIMDGVTATADELNRNDFAVQTLVADGAITVKNCVCLISKTVPGVVAATLADPVATTDDYKRLTIINGTAHASTVTSASAFGNGGAGEDIATMSATVGDTLNLMAYQGHWYITGAHQATVA
jgi:hypothetical protein